MLKKTVIPANSIRRGERDSCRTGFVALRQTNEHKRNGKAGANRHQARVARVADVALPRAAGGVLPAVSRPVPVPAAPVQGARVVGRRSHARAGSGGSQPPVPP